MTKHQAHFSEADEGPLAFAIGLRNACILVRPI